MRRCWLSFALVVAAASASCSSSSKNPGEDGGAGGSGAAGAGGSEAGDPSGCADGTLEQTYAPNMVGCDGEKNQCEAELLCGTGWHLCPLSEFAERGGDKTIANGLRWLRSCIRDYDDNTVTCPTEIACNVCTSSSAPLAPVSWDCDGNQLESHDVAPLGVVTSSAPSPRRVGCTNTCAYVDWDEAPAAIGAVCCK